MTLYRKRKLAIVLAIVCLVGSAQKCGSDNKIHEAAKASDRIATLVSSAIEIKRQLGASGQITREEELKLTEHLLTVAQRGKQFNEYARKLTEDTPQARLDLAETFSKVVEAINKFSNSAVFPIKDPEAKKRFLAILNSINASVAVIDLALKG